MENEIMYIKLDDIIPNRFQPREIFDEESLNKLAESIRQHGVIEPILVRPVSNKFEIIAGERRYKASVLAGLTKIPAMVRQLDDKESSIIAFIENEHRSGVSAVEEARTMERILKSNNLTQEELAKELGVNQSTVANKLRLLNLPMEVQEALMHNEISERHARSLLSVKDDDKKVELLKRIKENRMTVRELDSEIKEMNNNINNNEEYGSYQDASIKEPIETNINNNLNDNPLPTMDNKVMNEEPEFMDFLNNYDSNNYNNNNNSNNLNEVPSTPVQEEPDFMSFLNNYDANHPVTSANDIDIPAEPTNDDSINNFEVNEDQPYDDSFNQVDSGVVNFLNNYDNNNNSSTEVQNAPVEEEPDFMNFLNNYDANHPITTSDEPTNNEFNSLDYLNNQDNNPLPMDNLTNDFDFKPLETNSINENQEPQMEETLNIYNDMPNNVSENNNVMINDVTPPIASSFANQYVESNPNYVDISAQHVISNVDEIIDRLKSVIDNIKSESKFKIDTDEINFDDIYQITIKIDKRDF